MNADIKLAKLPKFDQDIFGEELVKVAGWGKTESGHDSDHLLEARVQLVELKDCQRAYRKSTLITEKQLCAKAMDSSTKPVDTCNGDSGGPLAILDNKTHNYIVIGITSYGIGCANPKYPGVYTRIDRFLDWINMFSGE